MARDYKTFKLSDEPKIAGIPVTTGLPLFLLTGIGLITGLSYQLFLIGAAMSVAMHLKFGGLPIRILLSIVYWSLPHRITSLLFPGFPDSANRLYIR
ncbi:TPA: type IV conjugative transfer system protein TraL [Legionella pneumophila]|uniref:Putative conjugative transfer protein TraL n=1 Tax=Legionella santicrucis TaxID=45074 RepID=A0A0W0ZAT2_9GAMM|nr:type IV conjugative transfer system protein TraL [Legionella santicrucis]KTD66216.1 putative conjugative transfer protein TraL [Legionella santicrucis]